MTLSGDSSSSGCKSPAFALALLFTVGTALAPDAPQFSVNSAEFVGPEQPRRLENKTMGAGLRAAHDYSDRAAKSRRSCGYALPSLGYSRTYLI